MWCGQIRLLEQRWIVSVWLGRWLVQLGTRGAASNERCKGNVLHFRVLIEANTIRIMHLIGVHELAQRCLLSGLTIFLRLWGVCVNEIIDGRRQLWKFASECCSCISKIRSRYRTAHRCQDSHYVQYLALDYDAHGSFSQPQFPPLV